MCPQELPSGSCCMKICKQIFRCRSNVSAAHLNIVHDSLMSSSFRPIGGQKCKENLYNPELSLHFCSREKPLSCALKPFAADEQTLIDLSSITAQAAAIARKPAKHTSGCGDISPWCQTHLPVVAVKSFKAALWTILMPDEQVWISADVIFGLYTEV